MIKLGNNSIGKIYLGGNSIGKAYLGSNLVFQKGESPTPPIPDLELHEYLYFDGTAYIETDIIPSDKASYRVVLGSETTKASQRCFYVPATTGSITMFYNSNTTTTNRTIAVYYGSTSASGTRQLAFSTANYTFFMTPKRFGWGSSVAQAITKGSGTPSGGIIIGTNSAHSAPFTGRISWFRIYGDDAENATSATDLYNNYTPQYTLKPCVYQGEVGIWCEETEKFYGNSAESGTLTVGD